MANRLSNVRGVLNVRKRLGKERMMFIYSFFVFGRIPYLIIVSSILGREIVVGINVVM